MCVRVSLGCVRACVCACVGCEQLYSDYKPYSDEADDSMQEIAQYQIFLTLFG